MLNSENIKSNIRAHEIDGIRGWAAFSVLLFHVFQEMLGNLLPFTHNAWLTPLMNGGFAVCVFFILSGDALTISFFSRKAEDLSTIDKLLVRRYTRLVIPILLSCSIVFLLRKLHMDFHNEATPIINRPDWLGDFINFDFSIFGLLKYSLIDVFTNHSRANSYNPFLWTMTVEMLGSMLVFLMCYVWPRLIKPSLVAMIIGLMLFAYGSQLSLFFVGILFGWLRSNSVFENIGSNKKWRNLSLVGIAVVFLLMGVTSSMPHLPKHFNMLLSIIFVFSVYCNTGIKQFFQSPLSKWLGDVSFPLYLVHFSVIISLMSWLIIFWSNHTWANSQAILLGIAVFTIVASLLAAWIFRKLERFLLKNTDNLILKSLKKNTA